MSEVVTTSEYAAWLAVMVVGGDAAQSALAEVGETGDPRPDLVPQPAYRTLYLAAEESDWRK